MSEIIPKRLITWHERWTTENIPWQLHEPNKLLVGNYHAVVPNESMKTFLMPLCGKSLDIIWLYNKGHVVIGIEGIQIPVQELFAENNIAYTVEKIKQGLLYQSNDKRLKIYVGDFFNFTSDIGKVDCVWDRAALVAVYKADRMNCTTKYRYVELMKNYLKPEARYLLSTVEYDGGVYPDVSPRCISFEEVKQLYGSAFKIDLLETQKESLDAFPHLGISPTYIVHHAMLIQGAE